MVTVLSGQLLGVAAVTPQEGTNQYFHPPPLHMQCIAAGSHIANHELESIELRPYAIELSKCIAKVRCALREQCFISRGTYPQNVSRLYNINIVCMLLCSVIHSARCEILIVYDNFTDKRKGWQEDQLYILASLVM